MSELLPTLQAADVRQGLVDYLATTFALADPEAQASLNRFLQSPRDGIFRGPFVRIRLPFRAAEPGWERALEWRPPLTPYGHQAAAFERLSSAGERGRPLPTLVTTGTGSGKTEAFLFPILDHVLRAKRAGEGGIKALILYPMNALANDQARRLATLITGDPALGGVRAALYTGQSGPERSTVTADGLITSRDAIRDEAPDILLTNYKMLDQLLLRPGDQDLWRASALSLRYLVLDEFHTYDGAQGTDVAMLLRRLGLALRRHWPAEHPDLDEAARARPLGLLTPVATSATLGDGGDPTAMLDFAATVFGEELGSEAVVGETRLALDEWAAGAELRMPDRGLPPVPLDDAVADAVLDGVRSMGEERRTAPLLTGMVLTRLYDDRRERLAAAATAEQPTEEDVALLLDAVRGHPFLRDLIGAASGACSLEDLAQATTPAGLVAAELAGQRAADRVDLVTVVLAALSHVRMLAGRAAPSIDLHLWVRSLTRIDRAAQPVPEFRWADDGDVVVDDAIGEVAAAAFPAIYCRHCGRSGWGVELGPVGASLALDDESIRRNHASRPAKDRFRPLIAAPREGRQSLAREAGAPPIEGLRWFRVAERELVVDPPAEDADPERSVVLPVLTHVGDGADDAAREDRCPSCDRVDGIRFLGSAVATQLSVAVTTMFGDRHLDAAEKKALVFTDSVQDAAHRAGFVQSRAHVFNFRNAVRSALEGTMSLHEVAERMLARAETPEQRFRLVPPDLVERSGFRPYWDPAPGQQPSVAVRNRVRSRLQFDLALEFGLQSRVGRTLELTGSVAASVDAGSAGRLEAIGRATIEGFEVTGRLDDPGARVAAERLVPWVRGTLERMRERGSIAHPWLRPYLNHNGERWYVWGGRPRNQGMPAFPRDREAPAFPRVGKAATGGRPSLLDQATAANSWYARWATRFFEVPAADGARLARRLFEQLAKDGVVVAHPIDGSEAVAYTIEPDRILLSAISDEDLAAGRASLVCDTCENPVPGSVDTVDQLADGPCPAVRCAGRLRRRPGTPDNYYRRQYDEGAMRRVVAREHTSLLDDATRLGYETAFKSSADRPDAPNVLVATPTLEMGIDIGDLSTVFLAGLPRTVASYVQRVGRAGRLTGNALTLAFVLGRGDQLPKLGDPLATIDGAVRPPATYLNAVEILRRQYVAFLVDTLSAEGRSGPVAQARDVLRRTDGSSFLATLLADAEEHAAERLGVFLGAFPGLADAAADGLRAWATPAGGPRTSGLAAAAIDASARWNRDVETLRLRRTAIEESLPALKAAAEAPTATSDDGVAHRAARASAAMVRRQLETLRGEHWVAALERFGLLPNYTLLDDRAQLDVAVSWIDPDSQEYVAEDRSYERGRSIAIQELAPGATFYAQGLEIAIDAVDLGREGAALRRRTFCPACGYSAEAGATPIPACPRCGEKAIADTNQTMPVVELEQVSAEVRRDESSISDRVDERTRTRFLVQLAPDFDPARQVDARFVAETGFGFRAYTDLELRWVNLGRVGGGSPRRIAGAGDVLAPLFRVCAGCGKLDTHGNTNSAREHRAWCRYRTAREEHVETIALTRTLRTQGLLLHLATWLTIGGSLERQSFAAAVQLGLGALVGGDPDHLRFAFVAEPVVDGDANPTGLLIHDAVPGGTGYLGDLADLGRLRRVLELARERLAECACAGEQRSACDRCLLPYAPNGSADAVSRVSALRSVERLLRIAENGVWTETREEPAPQDPDSHLEQLFRATFRERVEALGAAVQEVPGEWGDRLVITLPGQGRQWTLRPQVLVGPARPDFVLEASGSPVTPIAIFTDGLAYHASVDHNRVADDAEKRRALRELGYRVVAVTWRDLQDAQDERAASVDGWYDAATAQLWVDHFGLAPAALDLVTEDPVALLLRHVQDPLTTEDRWERVADALPFLTYTRSASDAADGSLRERAVDLATGAAAPGGDGGWALVRPHLAMATRRAASGETHTEVALVLDDRTEAVSASDFADAWRLWLRLSTLVGARVERRPVIGTVLGLAARAGAEPPAASIGPADVALPAEWAVVLDDAYGEERDLLLALSAVPGMIVPDVGLEVADGIPVGVAWADRRIAVDLGLEDRDREDLQRDGWRLVSPTPEAALAALNGA